MKEELEYERQRKLDNNSAFDMDLRDGKYLKQDILAVSGDWIIVFDGNGNRLVGAEIGVYRGETTRAIFDVLPIERMYCIDPYIPYRDSQLKHNQKQFNKDEKNAMERLKPFINKIVFLKMKSKDVVKEIKDGELDFIYIDGNHNYEFVKKDIELYYPKVKVGGILGGHDYSSQYFGVVRALNEFIEKHGLNIFGEKEDWWIKK